MSNTTLPASSYVLLPVYELDLLKRFSECARDFCLEVKGKDAKKAVSLLPEPEDFGGEYEQPTRYIELEKNHWRIYKKTKQMVRSVENILQRWINENPGCDVTLTLGSDEWHAQQYGDVAIGTGCGTHNGHLAISGGPWSVEVIRRNGELAGITLVNTSVKPTPVKAAPKKTPPKRAPAKAKGAKKTATKKAPKAKG